MWSAVAMAHYADSIALALAGDPAYTSLPIGVLSRDRIFSVMFLLCRADRAEPASIWAPKYACTLDPRAATIVKIERLSSSDAPVGTLAAEDDDALTARARYFQAFDLLAPSFARGDSMLSEQLHPVARDLAAAFAKIAEPALMARYRTHGGSFFRWAGAMEAR